MPSVSCGSKTCPTIANPSRSICAANARASIMARARIARASGTLRDLEPAHHGRACDEGFERARHVREMLDADEVRRFVEADEIAHPGKDRHVSDGVLAAHDPLPIREMLVDHTEHALRFADVAIARALVLEAPARELVEETDLPEHRPDPARLEKEPLQRLVTPARFAWHELPGLVGEIRENRTGLEERQRFSLRAVRVDDRGNLPVRIERAEFRRQLLVRIEVHA